MKALLVIMLTCILLLKSYGQDNITDNEAPRFMAEVWGNGGRALFDPARPMTGFEPYRGINAKIGFYTQNVRQWARDLNSPYYGIGFHYGRYGDKNIYGIPRGSFMFVGIPLWSFRHLRIVLDGSAGIAWGFKPHHPESNPQNEEVSSKVNILFNVNGLFEFPLTKRWTVTAGFGMTHYSNSITRSPNIGVNLLHTNLGLRHNFGFKPKDYFKPKLGEGLDSINQKHKPYWGFYMAVNGGIKQTKPLGDIYNINSTYAEAFYKYSRLARVTFGGDYFYDPSRMFPEWEPEQDHKSSHRIGIHVGHDFIINRAYLTTQMGLFVYEGRNTEEYFFFRLGGKIKVTNHLYVNATLMSFWVYAKMLEVGVGFNLY